MLVFVENRDASRSKSCQLAAGKRSKKQQTIGVKTVKLLPDAITRQGSDGWERRLAWRGGLSLDCGV